MSIKIISVGKKHEPWVAAGVDEYAKRLRKPFEVEWVLVQHSSIPERAREEESARILQHCDPDDFVILLDERGKQFTSPQLSKELSSLLNESRRVVIVIGGAFGVNRTLLDQSDILWSLSDLVFPHQLVRLMLIEQIYRAQTIALGQAYHHE